MTTNYFMTIVLNEMAAQLKLPVPILMGLIQEMLPTIGSPIARRYFQEMLKVEPQCNVVGDAQIDPLIRARIKQVLLSRFGIKR